MTRMPPSQLESRTVQGQVYHTEETALWVQTEPDKIVVWGDVVYRVKFIGWVLVWGQNCIIYRIKSMLILVPLPPVLLR